MRLDRAKRAGDFTPVVLLRTVLCVWVSVFLLLPNCLCELLLPFGIEIDHDDPVPAMTAAAVEGATIPEGLEFGNPPALSSHHVPCHCDESVNKVSDGEESEGFSSSHLAACFQQPSWMVGGDRPGLEMVGPSLRAPPPRGGDVQVTLCRFRV